MAYTELHSLINYSCAASQREVGARGRTPTTECVGPSLLLTPPILCIYIESQYEEPDIKSPCKPGSLQAAS